MLNVIAASLLLFVQKIDSSNIVQATIITIYEVGVALCSISSVLCYQLILENKAPELAATSTSLARCFNRCGSTVSVAFVLSLLQSQTADDLHTLRNTQPDVYNDILTYNTGFNYVTIKDIPSIPVKQTLNVMYYENIRIIVYGFMAWSIISLLSAIFAKIPSIPKKQLDVESEKK
jgi:predicted membrane channel-forming protein YqfA (hemolysin III family)